MMKVVVTGGGTAGHVTPLLAVTSELKHQHPTAQIRYIGNYGDRFANLALDHADIDGGWQIFAGKFRRFHGVSKWVYIRDPRIMLRNFRDFFYFILGYIQSLWLLTWWRPDVLFVKGGFVGLPVGLAAALLRIPIVTHDSDTVPGLTNRILARYARYMAVAMPVKYYRYPKDQIRYTGLPVRSEFVKVTLDIQKQARTALNIPNDSFVIAVFGGSLGAIRLNESVVAIAKELLSRNPDVWLMHQTGKQNYNDVISVYDTFEPNLKNRIVAWPFIDNVHTVNAAADIIVSRAGSSFYELGIQQKTVLLVPNPVLTGGHQTINANVLNECNAAYVVTENDLKNSSNKVLLDTLEELYSNPKKRTSLAKALNELTVTGAAAKIVNVLEEAIK